MVGKKLVENGQTRILQRIYDGVKSDLFLDISDFKELDNHIPLHLVWRKFPRNQDSTEGQRMNVTLSMQMEECSSAHLGLASSADLTSFMRKFLGKDTECYSGMDLGHGL